MKIFIDETAWVNILNPNSPYYDKFIEEFNQALNNRDRLFTHNIAVGLALSELKSVLGTTVALKFNEVIEEAYTGTYLSILWIGRRTQKEAVRLLRKNPEMLLDLYDFAAFIFMKRRRIQNIMTTKTAYDRLGFKVIPELGERKP